MTFEKKYPDRPPGSIPVPALLREDCEGRCKCGTPTFWIDCAFGMYVCSEECRSKEWGDFEKVNLGRGRSDLQDMIQEENRLRARLSKYEKVEGPFRSPIDCAMDSLMMTIGHIFPVEFVALAKKLKVAIPAHIQYKAEDALAQKR